VPSYGIVVEGEGDEQVFQHLIRKVNSPDAAIYCRVCGGVERLMKEFPDLLKTFEYAHNGEPVDGALVIRDCDNKPIEDVLNRMKEKLGRRTYRFPHGVELCAIKRKLDSWLLADEHAINAVCRRREISRVNETIEEITHPKERLQKLLGEAKVNYTSAVLGQIAAEMSLEQLEYRVPSFAPFKRSVLKIYRNE
jgi:hypothetical protein